MRMRNIILGGALILAAAGCAKNITTSSNEQTKLYIEAWLAKNHPSAKVEGNGIYVLEDIPGDGKQYNGETYAEIVYTVSDMNGNITSTLDEKTAQQVGTYSPSSYYGSKVWYTDEESISIGLEDLLKGMKVGETKTALIPAWLGVTKRMDSAEDYFKNTKNLGTTAIYKIKLVSFTDDINKWEAGKIEDYCQKEFGQKIDSTGYGYYYKQLKAPDSSKEFPNDTSFYINYTGRLLNGQVFDTTIKDTAKKYSLYSSSKTYEPVKINKAEKLEEIKMVSNGSESTVITGFQKILSNMKSHEKGAAIFISAYGYGTKGSGNTIFPYTPLIFEVEVTDKPE